MNGQLVNGVDYTQFIRVAQTPLNFEVNVNKR